jgi:hypothetical protein
MDFCNTLPPHVRSGAQYPPLPPSMTVGSPYLETPVSYTGTSSSSAPFGVLDEAIWERGAQEHSVEAPSRSSTSNKSQVNPSQQMYNPPPTVRDSTSHDEGRHSLVSSVARVRNRHLQPRPTPSSTTVVRGSGPQKNGNIGRRRGPLRPDQRLGASEVREVGACVNCRIAKIKVTWK